MIPSGIIDKKQKETNINKYNSTIRFNLSHFVAIKPFKVTTIIYLYDPTISDRLNNYGIKIKFRKNF